MLNHLDLVGLRVFDAELGIGNAIIMMLGHVSRSSQSFHLRCMDACGMAI